MNLSASEIAQMGVQIEINGEEFYNTLVQKTKIKQAKDVFEFMAAQEKSHIAVFRGILRAAEDYQPRQAYPQEYFEYMNALASDHVFTKKEKGKEAANSAKTTEDAVRLALSFEKESIIFYEGMKKVLPQAQTALIDRLIAEEQGHVRQLWQLYEGGKADV